MAERTRIDLLVPDGAAMAGHVRELETGTLFLKSNINPTVGEVLEVGLLLPGAPAPLVVSGRVARIETNGFGLALDPLPEAALIVIAATREWESPKDLSTALRRIEKLSFELLDARERAAQLQREAETNRAFYARALTQATGPSKGSAVRLGHVVALFFGIGVGVAFTLGVLLARAPPAGSGLVKPVPVPAPMTSKSVPLPLPVATLPVATVRDAGATSNDAGTRVVEHRTSGRPASADDSGVLNLVAKGAADVFIDGRHMGRAPLNGLNVRPGQHSIRFSCASDATRSAESLVTVPPFAEVDVEHTCE